MKEKSVWIKEHKKEKRERPHKENLGKDMLGLGVGLVVLGAGINAVKSL
jgi:hypothetical protein